MLQCFADVSVRYGCLVWKASVGRSVRDDVELVSINLLQKNEHDVKTRFHSLASAVVATTFLTTQSRFAQVQTLVIGDGGVHWIESIEETIGVDTAAVAAGAIQPFELDPAINIAVGPPTANGNFTNAFGEIWKLRTGAAGLSGAAPLTVTTDGSPFVYGSRGGLQIVDGDSLKASDPDPIAHYTMDLGFPLPINRVTWYAPPSGRTTSRGISGQLIKDLFPRQYVLSGSLNAAEFLFTPKSADFDGVIERNPNPVSYTHLTLPTKA